MEPVKPPTEAGIGLNGGGADPMADDPDGTLL